MNPQGPLTGAEVWLLPEAEVDGLTDQARSVLSADEHARWSRLRSDAARRRHLGARLLCRSVLGAYTGMPAHQLGFVQGDFGRPELLSNPSGLRFNLSHTDGLIVCVVTDGLLCGVDVERADVDPKVVGYAMERLTAAERARLEAADPARRARDFLDVWVLKEAYTKALGAGLQYGFDAFQLGPDSRGKVVLHDPRLPGHEAGRWQFGLSTTGTGHRLAVAVRRHGNSRTPLPVPQRLFTTEVLVRTAESRTVPGAAD
ncbi:4'-phosphopantetheinyl transferase superfamily protein [Streptomyces sp. NPDC001586]|uniref:4'-phosphopantetheinyl transferase family protein n=1 Tax=Streptomyces sp. NPDC001586 TaxID=3154387 RepID=UPI003329D273